MTNYRPISILSAIPKMSESFICDVKTRFLQLIDEQFGFVGGRSTELNLLTFVDFLVQFSGGGFSGPCLVHGLL